VTVLGPHLRPSTFASCSLATSWLRISSLFPHLAMWSSVRLHTRWFRRDNKSSLHISPFPLGQGNQCWLPGNLPHPPGPSTPPKVGSDLNPCTSYDEGSNSALTETSPSWTLGRPFSLQFFSIPPTTWSETVPKNDMSGDSDTWRNERLRSQTAGAHAPHQIHWLRHP
jgi:hypothetical protein